MKVASSNKAVVVVFSIGLSAEQESICRDRMELFLAGWFSHSSKLQAVSQIYFSQVLVVTIDEVACALSGCSLDALHRCIAELAQSLGVSLVEDGSVVYFGKVDESGEVVSSAGRVQTGYVQEISVASRKYFQELISLGRVDSDTLVLDTVTSSADDIADFRWIKKASECWHARAFSF